MRIAYEYDDVHRNRESESNAGKRAKDFLPSMEHEKRSRAIPAILPRRKTAFPRLWLRNPDGGFSHSRDLLPPLISVQCTTRMIAAS